jgi:hypothetical protein
LPYFESYYTRSAKLPLAQGVSLYSFRSVPIAFRYEESMIPKRIFLLLG